MEYHKTKDILHVMKRLGHKRIENTLLYTQLIQFEGDDYYSATADNIDEAKKLIETGFQYVCTHESVMIFRKRNQPRHIIQKRKTYYQKVFVMDFTLVFGC